MVHIEGVGNVVEVYVRSEQHALTDDELGDGRVQNVTVPVDEGGGPDVHVDAIIDVDWSLDIRATAGGIEVLVGVGDCGMVICLTRCRSRRSRVQSHGPGACTVCTIGR